MFNRRQFLLVTGVSTLQAAAGVSPAFAGKFNRELSVGDAAPDWTDLIGVDDRKYGLDDFKSRFLIVVFIANHCPVAAACEERIKALAADYRDRGVDLIAMSVSQLESDRLAKMKERAQDSGFLFPYLHDGTQSVGRRYGATVTPQVFILNSERRIAYMGAIDDNWRDAKKVETHYARNAIELLLAGKIPEIRETRPIGCAIEYSNATDKRSE